MEHLISISIISCVVGLFVVAMSHYKDSYKKLFKDDFIDISSKNLVFLSFTPFINIIILVQFIIFSFPKRS